MLGVLMGIWAMGAVQAGSGGTTICAGPWVQAEGYDWCPAGRPAADPETGEEGIEEIDDAFLVYCKRGWLRDKMLRVEGGWMHRANRTRSMVCESRSKVRGVEYPPEVANALTR
jgi:hypothetical protein